MVVGFLVVATSITAVAAYSLYGSLSYTSFYTAELAFDRLNLSVGVVLNFQANGPISAGKPLQLYVVQVYGEFPTGVTRIFLRVLVPGLEKSWPDFNQSVSQEPSPYFGYILPVTGDGIFRKPGTYSVAAWLILWVGATAFDMSVSPRDLSDEKLTVQPAGAWAQYDSLRVSTAVLVLIGGLTLFTSAAPSGIRNIVRLFKELSRDEGGGQE